MSKLKSGLINERNDTCPPGSESTSDRRTEISLKDISWALPISPSDKWLSLRDLIIVWIRQFSSIKRFQKRYGVRD